MAGMSLITQMKSGESSYDIETSPESYSQNTEGIWVDNSERSIGTLGPIDQTIARLAG
jgi:hypothetical protein